MSRVDLVTFLLFLSLGIAIPVVIVLHHFIYPEFLAWLAITGRAVVGILFAVLSLLVCSWNFYLAFVNPWLYRREHGSMDDYRASSGLPIIGGFFIAFAAVLLPASQAVGLALLFLYVIDGYGLPWVLVALIRDWDQYLQG